MSLLVLCWYGAGEVVQSPDPREIKHFHNARIMLLPALLLEVCYLISASASIPTQVHLHGYHMAFLVILEYLVKTACYTAMAHWDGGIVHMNSRAWGCPRACYTIRYVEWSIAVPTLLAINNFPLIGNHGPRQFAQRLAPNLVVTWAYIVASWVGQVTANDAAGWFLVVLSFAGYLVAVVDQVCIVMELRSGGTQQLGFKIAVVALKEMVFIIYGVVYLFGVFDIMSSLSEQVFYTYADVLLKVVQGSVLVIVRNWEDLARMQAALELVVWRGKEDMSRLIRKANAPILSMDVQGRITGWNEHLVRLSQIPEAQALGKDLVDLVGDECREPLVAALESCQQGLSASAIQVFLSPVHDASDTEKHMPVQLAMSFVMQLGADASSIVAIGQDLTELAEMKAVQARRTVLTATIGHELRSPLHGIMGLSGAMAEATPDNTQKRQLAMIRGCAIRLLDLVTNILEMSRTESECRKGKVTAPPAGEVDMMDLVDEVIGMTTAAVDKAGKPLLSPKVKIVNNMCQGSLPVARGDPYKIAQLLYNLLTNACKFTTQGTVTFNCRHDADRGMIEVDVADTGVGISESAMRRIFEPFEQEEHKDARSFQGVGLGLSVAMGIVKLHRGTLTVQSVIGRGSTFTVRLPCDNNVRRGLTCRPEPEAKQAGTLPQASDSSGKASGQPAAAQELQAPLLLSVDDDEINQEVVERTLTPKYRIVRAMNGMDALKYLASGNEVPSAVLLDVMMPGITGFKVCNDIRTKLGYGHLQLPILMLSARSPHEETALESFRCGATDHMQKPFSGNVIKMKLGVLDALRRELQALQLQAGPQCAKREPSAEAADAAAKPAPPEVTLRLGAGDPGEAGPRGAPPQRRQPGEEPASQSLPGCAAVKKEPEAPQQAPAERGGPKATATAGFAEEEAMASGRLCERAQRTGLAEELAPAAAPREAAAAVAGSPSGRSRAALLQAVADRNALEASLAAQELVTAKEMELLQRALEERDALVSQLVAQGHGAPHGAAAARSAADILAAPEQRGAAGSRAEGRVVWVAPSTSVLATPSGAKKVSFVKPGGPGGRNKDNMRFQAERGAVAQEIDFLRGELRHRDLQIVCLCDKLRHCRSKAWLQRHRADTFERELGHERAQRRPARIFH